jgi:hypothetical protein
LRTFYKHVVGQNKFAKEGKFLDLELVGNGGKGKRKRFEEKDWKKNEQERRK